MERTECTSCKQQETAICCSICAEATCKACAVFLDADAFQFAKARPEGCEGDIYCQACFAARVAPPLEEYAFTAERARDINVYFKNQTKESRLISRKEKPLKIEACDDREELILRLAFQAAEGGFDTLLDTDLKAIKVAQGGRYRKFMWNGSGIPANK